MNEFPAKFSVMVVRASPDVEGQVEELELVTTLDLAPGCEQTFTLTPQSFEYFMENLKQFTVVVAKQRSCKDSALPNDAYCQNLQQQVSQALEQALSHYPFLHVSCEARLITEKDKFECYLLECESVSADTLENLRAMGDNFFKTPLSQ